LAARQEGYSSASHGLGSGGALHEILLKLTNACRHLLLRATRSPWRRSGDWANERFGKLEIPCAPRAGLSPMPGSRNRWRQAGQRAPVRQAGAQAQLAQVCLPSRVPHRWSLHQVAARRPLGAVSRSLRGERFVEATTMTCSPR